MKDACAIRLAQANEIHRLCEIERLAGERFRALGFPEPQEHFFLSPAVFQEGILDDRVWVAVADDVKLVGFAFAEFVDNSAHLKEIDVLIDYGRRGIGARLIEAVSVWARAKGCSSLTLTTFRAVSWNAPYYSKIGFREMGPQEPGSELSDILAFEKETSRPGWERIAMIKKLNADQA